MKTGSECSFTTSKVVRDSDHSSPVFALPDRRSATYRTNPNKMEEIAGELMKGRDSWTEETVKYNLKLLLERVISENSSIEGIYLFGSRAYGTGSTRSDCDLLISFNQSENLKSSVLRDFSMSHCPALDFFLVVGGRATSCSNDSFVFASSFEELVSKLDAKPLWSKDEGFAKAPFGSLHWVFETRIFVEFFSTVLPNAHIAQLSWHSAVKRAEQNDLPVIPYIGDNIDKATAVIIDVVRKMFLESKDLCQRGRAKSGWTVNVESEYDCQNLFYTVMKPWLGSVGREEVTVRYDGQDKIADFNLFDSKLIIEMKFIDSDNKKREVVKTLVGLADFYGNNTNVNILLMLVFVKRGVDLDAAKWERDYTYYTSAPKVITLVISVP